MSYKNTIRKILSHKFWLLYIFQSIYFNFKYLPFNQAIKLPILLYKPKFYNLSGSIEIACTNISSGMILLGTKGALYDDYNGIRLNIKGGKIIFKGTCRIGCNSILEIGRHGILTFGNNFVSTCSLRLFCYNKIDIGENVMFGWDQLVMDTNFHPLKNKQTGEHFSSNSPISIGNECWFGSKCVIMPGASIAPHTVAGIGSVITASTKSEEYTLLTPTGNATIKKRNIYWDHLDDKDPLVYQK